MYAITKTSIYVNDQMHVLFWLVIMLKLQPFPLTINTSTFTLSAPDIDSLSQDL